MASPSPHVLTSASSTEESGEEVRKVEEGEGGVGEKEELIGKILELQNTLHDLTQRVNSVKEENTKLKSENEVWVASSPAGLLSLTLNSPPTGFEPVYRESYGHLRYFQILRRKKMKQLPCQLHHTLHHNDF